MGLTSVVFRPRVPGMSPAFIMWAVTAVTAKTDSLINMKRIRNVLRLITVLAFECRDVSSVDADGSRDVFKGGIELNVCYSSSVSKCRCSEDNNQNSQRYRPLLLCAVHFSDSSCFLLMSTYN